MNVSVRDYFEYYTESAAIDNANYSRSYLNSSSETCIPSDKDQVITLYLRNPQNYRLNYSYSYLDSNIGEIAGTKKQTTEDELYVKFDNDRNMVQLRFTSDFLQEIERQKTFTKVEDGRTVKYHTNLASGKIGITEPDSGRSFENFALNFHVNSYPPKVQGAALQRSGAGNDAVYILCFFMPELGEDKGNFNGIHDRDTRKLSINNNIYYINGSNVYSSASYDSSSDRWNFADENKASGFTTVQPSTLKALDGIGYSFDGSVVPTGYVVQYFTTGEKPSTEETRFTVSLIDDEGLNSAVTVSNRAKQLEKPEVIFEDSSMTVGEDDGLYEVTFTHGNRTREINTVDENGNAISYPSESVDGEISIGYTIKETRSGKVYSGNGTAPLKVKIPKGFYDFEVYAFKDYYITSLMNTDNTNVHIKESGIYYISSSGSEDGTGKKASPLRRIQQAVDRFEEGLTNNDFDSASVCSIRILSDISPTANDAFVNSSFIDLKSGRTYVLMGYDGTYTIDAAGKSRVIHAGAGSEYTFKNLVVRGGSSSTYGAGVYLESTSGNKIKAEFENVTVENNSGANAGGGIFFSGVNADDYLFLNNCKVRNNSTTGGYGGGLISNGSNGTIRLSNTVISENSCSDQGAGVYAECTLILEDGTEITGNTSGTSAAGVYTASTTTIKLSGKITINGNKAGGINSNVYLPDGVLFNIQGSIAGSVIGFTTEKVPLNITDRIKFTSGYGYGSTNTRLPGAFFKNDANFGVTYDESTKEAVLALGGGNVEYGSNNNLNITCDRTTANNVSKTFTFTVKDKNQSDLDVTSDCTYNYILYHYSDAVSSSYYTVGTGTSKNKITLGTPTDLPNGAYRIYVEVTYDEKQSSAMFDVTYTSNGDDLTALTSCPTSGTFSVNTPESIKKLSEWGTIPYGVTIKLEKDITLPSDFTSITTFKGVLDGNNKKLSGLGSSTAPVALINTLSGSSGKIATVKNLTVEGNATNAGIVKTVSSYSLIEGCISKVVIEGNSTLRQGKGGIAAQITTGDTAYTASNVRIKNCSFEGSLTINRSGDTTFGDIGGIVGYAGGDNSSAVSIENCINRGLITVNFGGSGVGGIVGDSNYASITGCKNYGIINSKCSSVGGILGDYNSSHSVNADVKIANCVNAGEIIGFNGVGGILGNGKLNVYNCINTGNVSSTSTAGGIAGSVYGPNNETAKIANCYNTGKVSASNYADIGEIVGGLGDTGSSYPYGSVNNCFSSGSRISGASNGSPETDHQITGNIKGSYSYATYNYYLDTTNEASLTDSNNIWYSCKKSGSACVTGTGVTIGSSAESTDVVQLLNNWISDSGKDYYLNWKYDSATNLPVFDE